MVILMNQTHIITFVRVTICLDIYSSVYWYTLLNNLLVISALTQPYPKYTTAFSITVSIAILISGPGRKVIWI